VRPALVAIPPLAGRDHRERQQGRAHRASAPSYRGSDHAAELPLPAATAADLGVPFDRFVGTDRLDREITWYLSTPATDDPLPLALWISGSGGQSAFEVRGGHPSAGLLGILVDAAEGRARVMVVEKPGVAFGTTLQEPGTAIGASDAFVREHTLERWVEANRAAVDAALARPDIDASTVLALGHSEGGQVVCHLAAADPRITHVASLAGGGPSQLFDLAELAWQPRRRREPLEDRQQRVDELYAAWAAITADSDGTTLFWGHPHRRWSSFLATSPLDGLRASAAKVYLAYGTEDTASPAVSGDVMAAELTRLGRDVTVERRLGDDHGFGGNGHGHSEGFRDVFGHVLDWWLGA
jgi:dienelactone hydrolase